MYWVTTNTRSTFRCLFICYLKPYNLDLLEITFFLNILLLPFPILCKPRLPFACFTLVASLFYLLIVLKQSSSLLRTRFDCSSIPIACSTCFVSILYKYTASIEPWHLAYSNLSQCLRVLLCVDNGSWSWIFRFFNSV